MTNDDVRKTVWQILTEFEKAKGQLKEHFAEKEAEIKKQEFAVILEGMKTLNDISAKRDEQLLASLETVAKGLATVVVKMVQRFNEIEKLLVAKLDKEKA